MSDNIFDIASYQFKNGDKVHYELGPNLIGEGTIVGVSSIPIPLVGATYLIEDKEHFPNEVYPYPVIAMVESAISLLMRKEKVLN